MKIIKKLLTSNYIASSFIVYLIGTILLQGISFITTPIFTRILSTSDYGITSIFNTWVNIFAVFIGLQVAGSIATARVHKKTEQFNNYMKNISYLSLVGAIIISLLCIMFQRRLSVLLQIDQQLIPHLLIQGYGASCAVLYTTYTIQTKKPKQNVIFSLIVTICILVSGLILVINFNKKKYLGRIYSGTIVYIFVIAFVLIKFIYGNKSKININDWKYSLKLSTPLIIHLLSNVVIGQSDRLFLNSMMGEETAAIYSVSYSIGSLGMIFAELCNKIWSPWYLDNTLISNHDEINKLAKKYIIVVCYVFATVILLAPEVLAIMAPKEYSVGIKSLIIIVVSVFFQYLYRFPLAYEQYSGNMKWVPISTITSAIINMFLNYILISMIGMEGAAIATLISYIILFGMHEFVARNIIKGYNIKFTTYTIGIIGCLTSSLIAYLIVDYLYLRYVLFIILLGSFILLIKKNFTFRSKT